MPRTWETLIVDVVKETLELFWAGVYNAVPHDNLHAMNPCSREVRTGNFFFRGKGAQRQNAQSDREAKSNWSLVV